MQFWRVCFTWFECDAFLLFISLTIIREWLNENWSFSLFFFHIYVFGHFKVQYMKIVPLPKISKSSANEEKLLLFNTLRFIAFFLIKRYVQVSASQASDFCVPSLWSYQNHKITCNKLTSLFSLKCQSFPHFRLRQFLMLLSSFLILTFVILSKQLLIHVVNVVIAEWIYGLLWQKGITHNLQWQTRQKTACWKTKLFNLTFRMFRHTSSEVTVYNTSNNQI